MAIVTTIAPEKPATATSTVAPEKVKKAKAPTSKPSKLSDPQLTRVAKKEKALQAGNDPKVSTDAKKAEREKRRQLDRMTAATLQAVANMLDDMFMGDRMVESAMVTKTGARLTMSDGKTVVISIKTEN